MAKLFFGIDFSFENLYHILQVIFMRKVYES